MPKQNDADFFQSEYQEINTRHKMLEIRLKPYLERFHAFLTNLGVTWSYAPWFPTFPGKPGDYYLVSGVVITEGVGFARDSYDGSESLTIPWDYIRDPDAWEAAFKEWFVGDKKLAKRLFVQTEYAEGYSIEDVSLSYDDENIFWIHATNKDNDNLVLSVDRDAKKLYVGESNYDIKSGQAKPIASL